MQNQDLWERAQKALGYTDEQLEIIKNCPKRSKIILAGPQLAKRMIVAEVIEAKNCVVHRVGDKIVFRSLGVLMKDKSCPNICLWALAPLASIFYSVYDRISSGLDPNEMACDHVSCWDTGVECGGFGRTTMKIAVE